MLIMEAARSGHLNLGEVGFVAEASVALLEATGHSTANELEFKQVQLVRRQGELGRRR